MSKKITRLWLGPHQMPDEYAKYAEKWQKLNPSWEVETLGDEIVKDVTGKHAKLIGDLIERDAGRDGVELFVQMADVIGYWLVAKRGGVYANVDIEPLQSLTVLDEYGVTPDTSWAGYEDQNMWVSNSLMGGPKGSPFWKYVLDELPASYWANPTGEMNQTTGPHHLTRCFRKHRDQLVVLDEAVVNPVHWQLIPPGHDASNHKIKDKDRAFVLHHWGHRKIKRTNHVETATQPELIVPKPAKKSKPKKVDVPSVVATETEAVAEVETSEE